MRALLYKEFSEHLRWSALAASAYLLVLLGFKHFNESLGNSFSTSGNDLFVIAIWGALAWGVTLGMLQFLRDGGNEWHGLLIHRNASIDAITYSKLLSGAAMLAISIGAPLTLAGLWWTVPAAGATPLFLMAGLPFAASVATAASAGYLAAAAISARRTRWWTTRCVPMLLPLLIISVMHEIPVGAAIAGIACCIGLATLVVAWQRAAGRDRQVGWGGLLCWSLGAMVPMTLLVLAQADSDARSDPSVSGDYCVLRRDGVPLKAHWGTEGGITYHDLKGALVPDSDSFAYDGLSRTLQFDTRARSRDRGPWWLAWAMWGSSLDSVAYLCTNGPANYYWCGCKQALVATSVSDGHMLGYVTAAGLAERSGSPIMNPTRFMNGTQYIIPTGRTVCVLDGAAQRLRVVYALADDEASATAIMDPTRAFFWVMTDRRFHIVDPDGQVRATFPLPAGMVTGTMEISTVADHRYKCLFQTWSADGLMRHYLLETISERDGTVAEEVLPDVPCPKPPARRDAGAIATLLPPALILALSHGRIAPAFSCAGALLAVALALLLSRRQALSRLERVLWCGSILAAGLLPLLPMLALRGGSVREPCPACGRRRQITHARCGNCGAPFPVPPASPYAIRDAQTPVPDEAMPAP